MSIAGISEQINLQDFISGFGRDVFEQSSTFQCSIEDIIKPLMTKIKKFNVKIPELFDRYDRNKNGRLSADELASALEKDMHITMEKEDVQAIADYFKNRHNSTEIGALDFMTLMNMKFTRVFDENEAKRSLALIK